MSALPVSALCAYDVGQVGSRGLLALDGRAAAHKLTVVLRGTSSTAAQVARLLSLRAARDEQAAA